jgi:hypothetical protein
MVGGGGWTKGAPQKKKSGNINLWKSSDWAKDKTNFENLTAIHSAFVEYEIVSDRICLHIQPMKSNRKEHITHATQNEKKR